jgi:GNAT superfamily N-acetyltransferase
VTPETLLVPGLSLVRATASHRAGVERLQRAAYARNRELLGVEPLPLMVDYDQIFRGHEVWVKPADTADMADTVDADIDAALIVDVTRADDILIWSVSVASGLQKRGLGHALLQCAEQRARECGRDTIRLYTGQPLTHLIDWYTRNGYVTERIEQMPDRSVVHMIKTLNNSEETT